MTRPPGSPADAAGFPGAGARYWGPPVLWPALFALVTLAAVTVVAISRNAEDRLVAAVAAAVALTAAAWTLRIRHRLVAGPDGMLVGAFFRTTAINWSQVTGLDLPMRGHLGVRSTTLEIEMGDDIVVFGRFDLGADPADVGPMLQAWWRPTG